MISCTCKPRSDRTISCIAFHSRLSHPIYALPTDPRTRFSGMITTSLFLIGQKSSHCVNKHALPTQKPGDLPYVPFSRDVYLFSLPKPPRQQLSKRRMTLTKSRLQKSRVGSATSRDARNRQAPSNNGSPTEGVRWPAAQWYQLSR